MSYLNTISGNIPQELSSSSNPWAYLAGILIVGVGIIAKIVYSDMKKREKQMLDLDIEHRKDSKERENKLNAQLERAIDANMALSETQTEMVTALNGVSLAVNNLQADVKYLKNEVHKKEEIVS